MANAIKMLQRLRVYADNIFFPKTLRSFAISFNQANDVYVNIYETAQLPMFYIF
jgi:hypothetical protein